MISPLLWLKKLTNRLPNFPFWTLEVVAFHELTELINCICNFYLMQAKEQLIASKDDSAPVMPNFVVKDLESLDGKYDTVICLDVLIHYPQSKADGMIAHLASLANNRLILSFAPKTFYYDLLKRIGELFPGPSKATRAYLHSEADVERALRKVGWTIRKRGLITTQFYFAKLIEAVPL